jgi:hypothetical protein
VLTELFCCCGRFSNRDKNPALNSRFEHRLLKVRFADGVGAKGMGPSGTAFPVGRIFFMCAGNSHTRLDFVSHLPENTETAWFVLPNIAYRQ